MQQYEQSIFTDEISGLMHSEQLKRDLDVPLAVMGNPDVTSKIRIDEHDAGPASKLSPFAQRNNHTLSNEELEMALRYYNVD